MVAQEKNGEKESAVGEPITAQGRRLEVDDVALLVSLIESNSKWGRYKLSVHIAELWNWRNAAPLLLTLQQYLQSVVTGKAVKLTERT